MQEHSSVIDEYLAKEGFLGRVFGPTSVSQLPNIQVSRFGIISKKDNGWRLIHRQPNACRYFRLN